jgi:hypothetical protein
MDLKFNTLPPTTPAKAQSTCRLLQELSQYALLVPRFTFSFSFFAFVFVCLCRISFSHEKQQQQQKKLRNRMEVELKNIPTT